MGSKIVQYFKDKERTTKEYPITLTRAVYDASGKRLDNILYEFSDSPDKLQDIKMLGWVVPESMLIKNTTDPSNQFHQKVGRVDLSLLDWEYASTPTRFIARKDDVPDAGYTYCARYKSTDSQEDKSVVLTDGFINIFDSEYSDAQQFKQSLAGLYLYYQLKNEIVQSVDGNEISVQSLEAVDLHTQDSALHVSTEERQSWNAKGTYSKPDGGVPKTDLANDVQLSLGKADSAIQTHQDISGKQNVLTPGDNITISGDTISAVDTTYNVATPNSDGLMSSVDKTKLTNIAEGATKVTSDTVASWGFTKTTGTYSKPAAGIPKTDLASAVQTSLDKADSALQSHQDISGKQDIGDNSLTTTSKTVVGAINELSDSVDSLEPRASQTEKELWDIKVGGGGKNLNSYPYFSTTYKSNNITFTDNGDGTVTVNTDGAASGNTWWNCHTRAQGERNDLIIPNGQYRVVGTPNGGSGGVNYGIQVTRTQGGSGVSYGTDYGNGLNFTANGDDYSDTEVSIQIQIYVKSGAVINNLVFKPMLTTDLNATYDDYEPYTPYNVREIGYASDDVKWLGWSVPKQLAVKNVAKNGGGLVQRANRVDLGTLTWVYDSTRAFFYATVSGLTTTTESVGAIYCSKYTSIGLASDGAMASASNMSIGYMTSNTRIKIKNTSYTDATAFRSAMSGVYLYYELGTSVEIAEGNEIGILRYADVTISASSVSAHSDVRATVTVPSGYTPISVVSLTNNNAEFVPYIRKVSDTSYTIIVRNTTSSTLSYQANTYRVVMARL